MKKQCLPAVLLPIFLLAGCSPIGEKTMRISAIYGIAAVLAVLLFIGYNWIAKKKDPWFLLLFSSIPVVNIGYFMLSVSTDLQMALWANRISYFGSVFLPAAMWMIILRAAKIRYAKWLPPLLLALAGAVFLIAASPGILDIYYKEVSFAIIDGCGHLVKTYGPWHVSYLFYLLGYFSAMITSIVCAATQKRMESTVYTVLLAFSVFINIGVWLIEQLVDIPFEMLSISYIISGAFLLGLNRIMEETRKLREAAQQPPSPAAVSAAFTEEQLAFFKSGVETLTHTERTVYTYYTEGKRTKEIMELLNITENTLKFHNKNIYSKLGVSSRKQLVAMHREII